MGSWSDYTDCPNCESKDSLQIWGSSRPIEDRGSNCYQCGVYSYSTWRQMDLEGLNCLRKERNENMGYEPNDEEYLDEVEELPSTDTLYEDYNVFVGKD